MAYQTIANHPKTKRLRRALNITTVEAVGLVILTQHWAMAYAPSGDLSGCDPADLADGVYWSGDADELFAALTSSGFIDPDGKLHNWEQYGGRYFKERDQGRERKAKSRQQKALKAAEATEVVTRDSAVTHGEVTQESPVSAPIDMTLHEVTLSEKRKQDLIPLHSTPPDALSADEWEGATRSAMAAFLDEDEEDPFRDAPPPDEPPGLDQWNGDLGWQGATICGREDEQTPSPTVPTRYGNYEAGDIPWGDDDDPEHLPDPYIPGVWNPSKGEFNP